MTTDKGRLANGRSTPLGEGRPRGGGRPMSVNGLRMFRARPSGPKLSVSPTRIDSRGPRTVFVGVFRYFASGSLFSAVVAMAFVSGRGFGDRVGVSAPMSVNRVRMFRVRLAVVAMTFAAGRAFRGWLAVSAR